MKLKWSILAGLLILMLSLQSCGGSTSTPAPAGLSEEDQLGTAVAGTLTSVGRFPTPTDTPIPTSTITLTPTRTPGLLRVVYSRAGSIWIWNEGGQPKQLTNNIVDAKPRLSADGQLVVFERNNELYTVNSNGSNLHVLVSDQFLKDYLPSGYKFIWAEYYDWKLDTHYVYFTTKTGISGPETDKFQFDLFRADVDSGDVRQILPPGLGGVPYFSLDGKTIALVQPTAIYLANTEGSGIRKAISFELVNTGSEWLYFPVVVSLPNGGGFRVVIPPHDWLGNPTESTKLWNIPIAGETQLIYSYIQSGIPFYSLAPNGETVGWDFNEKGNYFAVHFYSMNTSIGHFVMQGGNPVEFLNWSPDSNQYIYTGFDGSGQIGTYIGNISQGTNDPINATAMMLWVDNNRYFFVGDDGKLYLASIDGTQDVIDKGISKSAGAEKRYWQFDFSY